MVGERLPAFLQFIFQWSRFIQFTKNESPTTREYSYDYAQRSSVCNHFSKGSVVIFISASPPSPLSYYLLCRPSWRWCRSALFLHSPWRLVVRCLFLCSRSNSQLPAPVPVTKSNYNHPGHHCQCDQRSLLAKMDFD